MDDIKPELVDELLKGYQKPEDIIGENGLLKRLTKALLERTLNSELTHHLGYEKHDPAGHNSGNSRNGVSGKTAKGNSARSWSKRRETATELSNRRSWANTRRASRDSTTRFCRCTPEE
jgi:transposase-like protein